MLVNVNQTLKTMDGKTMKDNDGTGNAIDATVKLVIVNALLSPVRDEKGVDKVRKYELAKKVYASDEVDLNEDNIKLIKERVGEVFPPMIVGQIYELLKV
jgi:hypothetical protein